MTAEEIKKKDSEYIMHTYGRFDIVLDHGKGATLWDADGKEYVDLTSGIGVNSLGHGNEKIVGAITKQAEKLMHASNLYYTEPMVSAAEKLVTATGMGKIFFANSGAEANEGAIKVARKYSFDKYGAGRNKIVTLIQSFHGRTVTTLKATGQEKFHQYFFPFTEGFDYAKSNDLADVTAKADKACCAVMMEMIQGEGGVLPLDKEFVQGVAKFCKEHDILLIVDEVQTGIGRCGSLFAYEQYGISPDIVTMAKGLGGGLPIGGVLTSAACADVMGPGTHGSTFGGNPVSAASANVVLDTVNDPEFLKEVQEKGAYIKEKVLGFHSPAVKNVRGMGLMLGIIVDPEKRAGYVSKLMEKGILVLTAGTDAIRLLPPLVITYEEIDKALEAMKEVF